MDNRCRPSGTPADGPGSTAGDRPAALDLELHTAGGLTVEDVFETAVHRVRPGISRQLGESIDVAYEEAIVERLPRQLSIPTAPRVRIRLAATVADRADLPVLAEWLASQVEREPEAAAVVDGRRVEPDPGAIADALASAVDAEG